MSQLANGGGAVQDPTVSLLVGFVVAATICYVFGRPHLGRGQEQSVSHYHYHEEASWSGDCFDPECECRGRGAPWEEKAEEYDPEEPAYRDDVEGDEWKRK